MTTSYEQLEALARLILPVKILDYFKIVKIEPAAGVLHIYLDEFNLPPKEFSNNKLESKGFLPESEITDFPIRENKVTLHVRCRKWLNLDTGKSVSRGWNLTAKGTRYTESFAAFLKELLR